jgi:hypothetical protein
MIVEHWVTKRVEKGKRRVFFKKLPLTAGRLTITFKGLLGFNAFHLKATLIPNVSWFHVDVPKSTWHQTKDFQFVFESKSCEISTGNFEKSGKFEDLI